MNEITLKKYHGLGNDYLVLDPNKNKLPLQSRNIEMLCRRNFGVGADGLLYGPIWENGKWKVRVFNPDGSEAEQSGNGVRIFAKYLLDEGYIKSFNVVEDSLQGVIHITLKYNAGKEKVITGLRRVSKPGLRVYVGADELPRVLRGLGIAIISTSKGVMTDRKARELHVGGEVLAFVW